MSDRSPVGEGLQGWQSAGGVIEERTFGTVRQGAIDQQVGEFVAAHLEGELGRVLFRSCSTHVVYGVELGDRRRVVVKAFAPGAAEDLRGSQAVQAHLHAEGFPCPEPLVAPRPLGRGLALVEELVDEGEMADTHDAGARRLVAEALAWHLELTRDVCTVPAAPPGRDFAAAKDLWPAVAHSAAIDLHAPLEGTGPIDRLAALAQEAGRRTSQSDDARIAGHHDWSGKHFRLAGGRISAVYDWDSVMLGREAVIAGNAAMTHTANYDLPGVPLAPTPEEVSAFVDDYSRARRTPLGRTEREAIAAAATYIGAYTARCELATGVGRDEPGSFVAAMLGAGERYLTS